MSITSINQQNLYSIQQALKMSVLQSANGQNAVMVDTLIQDMEETNIKIMESSVEPHKGTVIDTYL